VTATVQGVNDNPTGLSIDDTNLLQSAGTDAPVGTLSASDVDNDGTELSYSLVEGAADNEKFGVDDDTLEAQDAATLPDDDYSVRVQVTDANGGTAEETFTITVEDDVEPLIQTVTISDVTDGDGILNQNDEAPSEPEDKDGYQDSDGDPENPPPTVSLAGMSVTEGQQQTLSADASDPEGKSLNYEWSLNGPGRLTGHGEEVVYKAPSSPDGITRGRTADVTVTVTTTGETRGQSEKSATATAQVGLEDINPPPSVSLPDQSVKEGNKVTLTADATNPEDDGISYQWSKDGPGSLSSARSVASIVSSNVSRNPSVSSTSPTRSQDGLLRTFRCVPPAFAKSAAALTPRPLRGSRWRWLSRIGPSYMLSRSAAGGKTTLLQDADEPDTLQQ
jgi:hypothetical protein